MEGEEDEQRMEAVKGQNGEEGGEEGSSEGAEW